ncbi:MAG TPA: zinc ribbon domain-containing protein [Acidimicrobiia bacterium]|jgi:putative FmdB family regulatory protein|nr:zinc ribbon domain-containing protein [Acidimicrobiia bacterium]
MPTYQYRCAKCGEQFELWQSIHDDALQKHPGCGGSVTKVMAPAGIVLKGSGFYRTDSRAGGRRGGSRDKEPAKDGAASGNGSSGDSDSKSSNSEKTKDSNDSKASKDAKTSTDSKSAKSAGSKRDTSSK